LITVQGYGDASVQSDITHRLEAKKLMLQRRPHHGYALAPGAPRKTLTATKRALRALPGEIEMGPVGARVMPQHIAIGNPDLYGLDERRGFSDHPLT
jgi:hypothetical protein